MIKCKFLLKNLATVVACFAVFMFFSGCEPEQIEEMKSDEKQIIDFYFSSLPDAVIVTDHLELTIDVDFPVSTNVTSLSPTIEVSEGATIKPASGVAQNFTNPVKYTVTAEDGTKAEYTVTVTVPVPQIVELTSPISADRTLVDLGLPIDYVYKGNNLLQVNNNATLTIEPGVTIQFTQTGGGMEISGGATITAIGTEDKPIQFVGAVFPSPNKGLWRGIVISAQNEANGLKYVEILNAGSQNYNWSAALYLSGGKVDVNYCLIDRSLTNGITLNSSSGNYNSAELRTFDNNKVSNCTKAPVFTYEYTSCYALRNMGNNNLFENNTNEYIHISQSTNTRITGDMTLHNLSGYPWYFQNGFEIYNDVNLTIEAGAVVLMGANQRLNVPQTSHLIAVGTAQKPITIKGFNDEPGYWNGILVDSRTPGTKFDYCNISNGGRGGNANWRGLIHYYNASYIEIYNTHLSKSLNHGVVCGYSSPTSNLHYNAFLKHDKVTFSDITVSVFFIAEPSQASQGYPTMPKMAGAGLSNGWWQHSWIADNNGGEVDAALIGKWELKSLIISGIKFDLPYQGINSGGYEFTTNTVKGFVNGSKTQEGAAYSEGNKVYSGEEVNTWAISGTTLTLTNAEGNDFVCEKVSKFSWE